MHLHAFQLALLESRKSTYFYLFATPAFLFFSLFRPTKANNPNIFQPLSYSCWNEELFGAKN